MAGSSHHYTAHIQYCGPPARYPYLRNEVDSHLSLRGLDGRVSLAGWNGVALAKKLEVVDKRFHALLHRGTGWRHKLVVVNADGTFGNLVQTLNKFPL
jgi:hypothetical protein